MYVCLLYDPRDEIHSEVNNAASFFKEPHETFDHVSTREETEKKGIL